jgi:hypothetical protein
MNRKHLAVLSLALVLGSLLGATVYNQFSPGGALSGTWNSQNVNVGAGSPFITGTLPAGDGGTGSAFTAFSGPATSVKTFTLPNASANILTDHALVTVAQGGTSAGTLAAHGVLLGEGTSPVSFVSALAADTLLQGQGITSDPAAVSLVNCGDSTHALAYSTSTHTFSCQTITAGGGGATVQRALKGADTTRTNTTTAAADPDLTFTVASGAHTLECYLQIVVGATGNTPGFKAAFVAVNPTPATPQYLAVGENNSASFVVHGNADTTAQQFTTAASTVSEATVNVGWTAGSGGTVSVNWAQVTTSATATTLKAGSYCLLT